MATHNLTVPLLAGNGVPVSEISSNTQGAAVKAVVEIAPAYQFQREDGALNWAVVNTFTTDTASITIPGMEDADTDGADVIWEMRVKFLDRANGYVGGDSVLFKFADTAPTEASFPDDVILQDVALPPEYGPTWAVQAEAAAFAAQQAQVAAQGYAAAAQAVPTTSDGIIAGRINTSGSATDAALSSRFVKAWKPSTSYAAGIQVVAPNGDVVTAKTTHTSDSTFDINFWNLSPTFGRTKTVNGVSPDGAGNVVVATGDPNAGRIQVMTSTSTPRLTGSTPVLGAYKDQPSTLLPGDLWLKTTAVPVIPVITWHSKFDAGLIGLADAAAVGQWDDTSGNARHAIQATTALKPTYRVASGSVPAFVNFFGTDLDCLQTAAFATPLTQPFTVFMLIRSTNVVISAVASQERRIFDGLSSTDEVTFGNIGDGTTAFYKSFAGTSRTTTQTPVAATWELLTIVHNGASSYQRRNGVQYNHTASPGANSLGGLTLGAKYDQATLGFRGDMAFFGLQAGVSTSITSVEAGLAARAGITLP